MKKGIIAITLLLSGALLISPITTNASSTKNITTEPVVTEQVNSTNNKQQSSELKNEAVQKEENIVKEEKVSNQEINKNETIKEEIVKEEDANAPNEVVKDENVESGMTKVEAEVVLNNYLNNSDQSDITYTYKGDENTFEAMNQKGIRGYVFLPNIETDLAYLVDKDNGSIYYFHPSGYFDFIQ